MTTPANYPTGSTVGQPWADNMPLTTLASAMATDVTTAVSLQQAFDTQRFWSTPARAANDTTQEVMQVTLTSTRLVNKITFDVAIFPQIINVEYFDTTTNTWLPCSPKGDPTTVGVTQTINTSYPQVLPLVTNITGHIHPQHSFSGHWQTIEFVINPITSRLFRVLLQRTTNGTAPTDPFGDALPYSLAIRNFYIGYEVVSIDDVPVVSPASGALTASGSFATTTDLLGSTVDFTITTDAADNVLNNGRPGSSSILVWKCEPQPFPWAVVNFYVDTRDANGNAQVIDRFFLEPLYTGPSVHLYYSNDTLTTTYPGSTDPLVYPFAQIFNPNGVSGDILHSGPAGKNKVAFVTIDNQVLSFDPSRSWWVGASVNFKMSHGSENFDSPIFDCGAFQIFLTPFGLACQTQYGDTLAIDIDPFYSGNTLNLIVAYDGIDTLSINAQVGPVTYSGSMPLPVPLTNATVTTLCVGAFLNRSIPNWFDYNDFILKTDDIPNATTIQDFLTNPEPYVQVSSFQINADPRTNNALLRYHPGWATTDVPAGFIGGEPDRYAAMTWSPIARDFVLTRGNFDIPSTKAKYWKFEFSNLVAESYEVYQPISQTVKVFTYSMTGISSSTQTVPYTAPPSQAATLNATYMVNSSVTSVFDNGTFTQTGTGAAQLGLTPTQARVIYDANSRAIVGAAYWAWNFLPVHSGPIAPIFPTVDAHIYDTVNITQNQKIAYFVGLISIAAYRLDALATDDTVRYVDNFYDMTNISTDTNWTLLGDHQLTSGASKYAVLQSQPFSSTRIVTGVQFACQQSDAIQYLPDADFNDPNHTNWAPVGDAKFAPGITVDTTLGSTIQINRASIQNDWGVIESGFQTWQNIINASITWSALALSESNPQVQGGITSAAQNLPAGGRVSVAARVIAPTDLTSPLFVQIVDDFTGNVLSQEPITVKGHQVTEWYTSYTIGDITTPPWRWKDFLATPSTQVYYDSFSGSNAAPLPALDSGQLWQSDINTAGLSESLSLVSNKATATVDGQYNYIDVKQPWGTLEFVVGTMGTSPSNLESNPLFATNTTGWASMGTSNTTLARATTPTINGTTTNCLCTSTTTAQRSGLGTNSPIIVIPGVTYRLFFDVLPSQNLSMNILVNFFTNTSVQVNNETVITPVASGVVTTLAASFTAPPGSANAYIVIGATMPVGATFNITNIYFGTTENMLVGFDPFFLDQNGSLNDRSGTPLPTGMVNVLTTNNGARAVQVNDDIRIDFLPTYLVPGNRQDINHSSNPDPVAWPYSMMFYVNGSWVRTISHDMGALSLKTIKGHIGQQFASWSWTPFQYGQLPGICIEYLPRFDKGQWVDATTQTTFQDSAGNVWTATGGWDISQPSTWPSNGGTISTTTPEIIGDNIGPTLTPTSSGSTFTTDTGVWYGAMTVYVRNVATGQSSSKHGYILVLDNDNGVFLDYQGNIVQNGTSYGNIIPSGISANQQITIQWARTGQVSAATRGGINATQFPDMIIAKVNEQIVGTYTSTMLTQWRGTHRGVTGDIYNIGTGSRPNQANYLLDTSFRTFHWAPDASLVAQNPAKPTWNDVTNYNSITYAQATRGRGLGFPALRAQLVQFGQSQDAWDVDNLSMFVDPIVWSFSNDGGFTFYPAYDIRNNPNGVLSFPTSSIVTQLGRTPGTALVWRATCYAPDRLISSLVIRPWYAGLLSGLTQRVGVGQSGPNLAPSDQTPPLDQDPAFQVWSNPIPQSWWYQFQLLGRSITGTSAVVPISTGITPLYPGTTTFPGPQIYPGG